jgi:hypothetical protein
VQPSKTRSTWGPSTYGDPCRECGFRWSLSADDAISVVSSTPGRVAEALEGHDPASRHHDLTWSALAYVCHITDNLRIWAERLAGTALGSTSIVSPYDGDLLARARANEGVPVEGALAVTNAHDAYHHVWDIERSTG